MMNSLAENGENDTSEVKTDENHFEGLQIDDASFLDEIEGRCVCPKCNKSRKYFCYTCYIPVKELEGKLPRIRLPLKVDIIKHPKEIDGKSTAIHAAILCPDDVRVFTYPCFPDYPSTERVVLIFPDKTSGTLEQILEKQLDQCPDIGKRPRTVGAGDPTDPQPDLRFDRALFIDSTWNQTNRIIKDERLKAFPRVHLCKRTTLFWRFHHDRPKTHLSTIEAIHQFVVEYHCALNKTESHVTTNEYDNLLFFFKFMFHKIRGLYDPATLKAYQ